MTEGNEAGGDGVAVGGGIAGHCVAFAWSAAVLRKRPIIPVIYVSS